jgi:peptidoglycan/LPS O-acetylase OafA/YrhL
MSSRIDEITGLRCFAVTMVVLTHAQHTAANGHGYTGWLSPLKILANGNQGILLFFVLSGFLITGLLQREFAGGGRIDFLEFYRRRTLRIWPASYFYILVLVGLTMAGFMRIDWREFLAAAAHIWNYGALLHIAPVEGSQGGWYLGHFWTLALEEQFYWIWPPILIYLLHKHNDRLLMALIVAIPLVRILFYFAAPAQRGQLTMMLHTGLDPMLIGGLMALRQRQLADALTGFRYRHALLTLAVILFVAVTPAIGSVLKGAWNVTYGQTIDALLSAVIILGIVHVKDFWLSRLCRQRIPVFVGTISYSLYLWQQLFLNHDFAYAMAFPFNIVQAFTAACVSCFFVERPFLRMKDRQRPDAVPAPSRAG